MVGCRRRNEIISRSYVLCELGEVLLAHRPVLPDHRAGPPPPQAEHVKITDISNALYFIEL